MSLLSDPLKWPDELPGADAPSFTRWQHQPSNRLMDIHGDPGNADLVIFSDGNHHMALADTIQAFDRSYDLAQRILYLTLPPRILLDTLDTGGLQIGNLVLGLKPHVMIGPAPILDRIVDQGRMLSHRAFMQSRGNMLMTAHGNPLNIQTTSDLYRNEVRLFISNPVREAASFCVYRDTLRALADAQGLNGLALVTELESGSQRIVHGDSIHHREAPVAVATGSADVAILYFHLALRYTRVFNGEFELIPLPGSPGHAQPTIPGNIRTFYHAGVFEDAGEYGDAFEAFLHTRQVAEIYSSHGLEPPDVNEPGSISSVLQGGVAAR